MNAAAQAIAVALASDSAVLRDLIEALRETPRANAGRPKGQEDT